MGTEEAIIYSFDLATVPSVIPAFANAKDVLICDEVRLRCLFMRIKLCPAGASPDRELLPPLQEAWSAGFLATPDSTLGSDLDKAEMLLLLVVDALSMQQR